jgi:hypothetical protein
MPSEGVNGFSTCIGECVVDGVLELFNQETETKRSITSGTFNLTTRLDLQCACLRDLSRMKPTFKCFCSV